MGVSIHSFVLSALFIGVIAPVDYCRISVNQEYIWHGREREEGWRWSLRKGDAMSANLFINPFHIDDLSVFDDDAWHNVLSHHRLGLTVDILARAARVAPTGVIERIARNLPVTQHNAFWRVFAHPATPDEIAHAQRKLLDLLFWELIYWRMPHEYELLTENERLHPGIFQHLAPDLRGKTVLDAGAGSGRTTLACLEAGVARVFAVEPSPGLRAILRRKLQHSPFRQHVVISPGRFAALPLTAQSVDVALSCSVFTALPEQGGESGLAELLRVTRPGGKIFVLWPRAKDHAWLRKHDFQQISFPEHPQMAIHFRSLADAIHCAHLFYGRKPAVLKHILATQKPEIPFALIGINPPDAYCWREVPLASSQPALPLAALSKR